MKNYVLCLIPYRFCQACQQINENKKGHQGTDPDGLSFVFLNTSINKKPFFLSQIVTYKNRN